MAEAKEFFSAAKHALEEVKNTQREAVYEAAKMNGRLLAGKRSCPAVRFRTTDCVSMELGYVPAD